MMEKLYYKSSFLPSAEFNRCVLCLHSSSDSSIISSLSSWSPNIPGEFPALRGWDSVSHPNHQYPAGRGNGGSASSTWHQWHLSDQVGFKCPNSCHYYQIDQTLEAKKVSRQNYRINHHKGRLQNEKTGYLVTPYIFHVTPTLPPQEWQHKTMTSWWI